MKIIISPAKKMNVREDEIEILSLPCFLSEAELLKNYLKSLTFEEARELWACSEAIAGLNRQRLLDMDLRNRLTPALLAYEGLQYQYMAPSVFEQSQWDYVQEHLRILSGFYGILKPLDGIVPYRLEMQAGAEPLPQVKGLYAFWGNALYESLRREENGPALILNLASREYSRAVEPYLRPEDRFITFIFGRPEEKKGKRTIRTRATEAKMARGEMVRFLSEVQAADPEAAREFNRLGYVYSQEDSTPSEFVFLKQSSMPE